MEAELIALCSKEVGCASRTRSLGLLSVPAAISVEEGRSPEFHSETTRMGFLSGEHNFLRPWSQRGGGLSAGAGSRNGTP